MDVWLDRGDPSADMLGAIANLRGTWRFTVRAIRRGFLVQNELKYLIKVHQKYKVPQT